MTEADAPHRSLEFKKRGVRCQAYRDHWSIHCALAGCEHCSRIVQGDIEGNWSEEKFRGAARVFNYYGQWPGPKPERLDYLSADDAAALPRPSPAEQRGGPAMPALGPCREIAQEMGE